MAWQDRPYYRDRPASAGGPLMWLLNGSLPLGTWFGIRVRAHASLVILAALTVLFPGALGGVYGSLSFLAVLFGIVLLHEFGHCFASRSVGGDPRDILMTPIGGLAFADAPKRPWATFWTVAGGPLVNVLICAVAAGVLLALGGGSHGIPLNPYNWHLPAPTWGTPTWHFQVAWWSWWVFVVSYVILLFNLWPIFPLDGGQLLQSLLWVKFGYYKSMKFATITGMIGAVVMAALGLAGRELLLVFIAVSGFMTCYQMRMQLAAMGPEDWQDSLDYGASLRAQPRDKAKSRRPSRWAMFRARRAVEADAAEQETVDRILKKVSDFGMNSLTRAERKALKKATEHQRQRDLELAKGHGKGWH